VAEAVGQCVWVEGDDQIDAVTAISGSGPAYVFYFVEAMERAAIEMGLSAEQGRKLAVETFRGPPRWQRSRPNRYRRCASVSRRKAARRMPR
jgi:pyrroline-5-carboxylate reductase